MKAQTKIKKRSVSRTAARVGSGAMVRLLRVRPWRVRKGDRIFRGNTCEQTTDGSLRLVRERIYLGTADCNSYDCAENPQNPCWKVYVSGGEIGRVFFRNEERVWVQRKSA